MSKRVSEIRKKSVQDLEKEAKRVEEEIAKLKLENTVNPAKDTNILIKKKKYLAVILTILGEKKEIEKIKS